MTNETEITIIQEIKDDFRNRAIDDKLNYAYEIEGQVDIRHIKFTEEELKNE